MSHETMETSTTPSADLERNEKQDISNLSAGKLEGESSDAPAAPAPGRTTRGFKWFLVVTSIMSSMFIQSLDNTITADLVPAITSTFQSVDLLPWISVGYMFGSYISLLPLGKMYARYNNKWIYIANVVLFAAASAVCGAAPNMPAMIVGRVLLGIGGSGLYCGIMTLVSTLADGPEIPLYFSITGVVWCVGTVLGPVVGGAFASINDTTWRWSFYINIIIGGIFLPIYVFVLPSVDPLAAQTPRPSIRERGRNFDITGTILMAGSVICLIMAINFGGVLYAWNSGSIIALFVVGFVLAIVFGVQQRISLFTTPQDRIFPAPLLTGRDSLLLFLSTIGSNAASFAPIYYIPVYFQFTRGDTALEAAVRLLPLIILFGVANLTQGSLLLKFPYWWPWFLVGGSLALAGNVMLYVIDVDTTPGYIYGAEVLLAIGIGLCNQTPYGVIHGVIPMEYMGLGVPFIMIAQYTGITFGLSIAGAVFINMGLNDLKALLPDFPQDQLSSILSGTSGKSFESVPEELRGAVLAIIVDNLRKTFVVAFAGSAVVVLTSLFYRKQKKAAPSGDAPAVMAG